MSEAEAEHGPQLAVVDGAGRVAMARRPDGSLALPTLPGWNGAPPSYTAAVSRRVSAGHELPAALEAGLTHLTPLSWGAAAAAGEDALVLLAETWAPDLDADAWWTPGSPPPHGLPAAAQAGLLTAVRPGSSGSPTVAPKSWPFFCLPGATASLRDLLERDEVAGSLASLSALPRDGEASGRELRQVQGWPLSSVWLNEEVVLKLANPAWLGEPRLTAALAAIAPGHVPEVISHGLVSPRGLAPTAYLLQRRVVEPDPTDDEAERVGRSLAALSTLAELQLSARGHEDRLRSAGASDRGPQRTNGELARLWEVVAPALDAAERASLPAADARLRTGLDRLARTPSLLVHGDLHLGNVLADGRGAPQLIDWTDAAFAWPGVDLYTVLNRLGQEEPTRELVTAAYVEALGSGFEEAVRLGLELAPTYHALSYLRISDFLPGELGGIFNDEVTRLVRHQLEVFTP